MRKKVYVEGNYIIVERLTGGIEWQRPFKDTTGEVRDGKLILTDNAESTVYYKADVEDLEDNAAVQFTEASLALFIRTNTGQGGTSTGTGGTSDASEATLLEIRNAILAQKDGEFVIYLDSNDNNRKVAISSDLSDPANPTYVYKYLDTQAAYTGNAADLILSPSQAERELISVLGEDSGATDPKPSIKQVIEYVNGVAGTPAYTNLDGTAYTLLGTFQLKETAATTDNEAAIVLGFDAGATAPQPTIKQLNTWVNGVLQTPTYVDLAGAAYTLLGAFEIKEAAASTDYEIITTEGVDSGVADPKPSIRQIIQVENGVFSTPTYTSLDNSQYTLVGDFELKEAATQGYNVIQTIGEDRGVATPRPSIRQVIQYTNGVAAAATYETLDGTAYTLVGAFDLKESATEDFEVTIAIGEDDGASGTDIQKTTSFINGVAQTPTYQTLSGAAYTLVGSFIPDPINQFDTEITNGVDDGVVTDPNPTIKQVILYTNGVAAAPTYTDFTGSAYTLVGNFIEKPVSASSTVIDYDVEEHIGQDISDSTLDTVTSRIIKHNGAFALANNELIYDPTANTYTFSSVVNEQRTWFIPLDVDDKANLPSELTVVFSNISGTLTAVNALSTFVGEVESGTFNITIDSSFNGYGPVNVGAPASVATYTLNKTSLVDLNNQLYLRILVNGDNVGFMMSNMELDGVSYNPSLSSTGTISSESITYIKQVNKYQDNVLNATEYVNIDNTPYTLVGAFKPLSATTTETKLDTLIERKNLEVWDSIVGNSKVIAYYTGIVAGNPSGNVNIETVEFRTGATVVVTQTFTYDVNDNILTSTAS